LPLPGAVIAEFTVSVPVMVTPLRSTMDPSVAAVRPASAAASPFAVVLPATPTRFTDTAAMLPTVRPLFSDRYSPPLVAALADTLSTFSSMALVPRPTPAPEVNRTLPAVTLTVCVAPSLSASLIAPPATRLTIRWSVVPALPAFSWPSTRLPTACTRIAPLLVTNPEVAPIVTSPAEACTSTVLPSESVVS